MMRRRMSSRANEGGNAASWQRPLNALEFTSSRMLNSHRVADSKRTVFHPRSAFRPTPLCRCTTPERVPLPPVHAHAHSASTNTPTVQEYKRPIDGFTPRMADPNPVPDAQEIQRLTLAAAEAADAQKAADEQSTDVAMSDLGAAAEASKDQAPAAPVTLQVHLQPHMSADQLTLALTTLSDAESRPAVTLERLQSPDAELVLHLYDVALQAFGMKQQLATLKQGRQQTESTLSSLRNRNTELEQELDAVRRAGNESTNLTTSLQTEINSLQSQLGSVQTEFDNEKRESTAAKERSAELATELTAAQAQSAALKTDLENERRAKELLTTLKSSTESGVRHAAEVRGRLDQVEQEKRDLLASLQREREESTRKAEEIDALLTRNRDARHEISRLSTAVQESRSQENIATFKLQSLEQEIKLTKKNSDWAHDQLAQLNDASAAFRATKRAELTRVQADLDAARQEATLARSKVDSLQTAYTETSSKLTEASEKLAELQSRLASQEDSFRTEVSNQSQLVKLLERRAEHAAERIKELEEQWEDVLEQCRAREEAAWAEDPERAQLREALEKENRDLSEALDRLAEGVGIGQQRENGENLLDQTFDALASRPPPRSPTASASPASPSARSTWSSPRRKKSCVARSSRPNRLTAVLAQVMDELQERAPELQAQREETERLAADLEEMVAQVASASQERDTVQAEAKRLRLDLERITRENGFMLLHVSRTTAASWLSSTRSLLCPKVCQSPIPRPSITNELVTFASAHRALQSERPACCKLRASSAQRWRKRRRTTKRDSPRDQDEAVNEARDLILRLEDEVRQEQFRVEEVSKGTATFSDSCAPRAGRSAANNAADDKGSTGVASAATRRWLRPCPRPSTSLANSTRPPQVRHRCRDRSLPQGGAIAASRDRQGHCLFGAAKAPCVKRPRTNLPTCRGRTSWPVRLGGDHEARCSAPAKACEQGRLPVETLEEQTDSSAIQPRASPLAGLDSAGREGPLEGRRGQAPRGKLLHPSGAQQPPAARPDDAGNAGRVGATRDATRPPALSRTSRGSTRPTRICEAVLQPSRTCTASSACVARSRPRTSRAASTSPAPSSAMRGRRRPSRRTSADHTQLRVEGHHPPARGTKEKLAVYERRDQLSRDPVAFPPPSRTSSCRGKSSSRSSLRTSRRVEPLHRSKCARASSKSNRRQRLSPRRTPRSPRCAASTSSSRIARHLRLPPRSPKIQSLQQQVAGTSSQLSEAQAQLEEVQKQLETERAAFQAERSRSKTPSPSSAASRSVRAPNKRTSRARSASICRRPRRQQQKLETVSRNVDNLTTELAEAREQLNKARQEVGSLRSSKDLAEAEWGREKASWEAVRRHSSAKRPTCQRRMDDLTAQNQILHTHLETINAQASQIREAAAAPLPSFDVRYGVELDGPSNTACRRSCTCRSRGSRCKHVGCLSREKPRTRQLRTLSRANTANAPSSEVKQPRPWLSRRRTPVCPGTELRHSLMKRRVEELQELVQRLQRDKDLVGMQMEMTKQETSRLQKTLEHHAELLDKINQLNELRESHSTLQETASRAEARAAQLEAELRTATSDLEPVRAQLRTAQIELEASQAEVKVLREDSKRWQARSQSLLQTHGISEEMQKVEQQRAEAQQKIDEDAGQAAGERGGNRSGQGRAGDGQVELRQVA
ncbi:hypothetical protein L1887_61151 [Cichorium endivia]|nr:hypothetical protein L1887_61151 [Cichorium endivia]